MTRLSTLAVAAFLVMLTIDPREAPATVAEQRARLPPAAECASPVAGKWKALVFFPPHETWYEWILEVREDPNDPSKLTGDILVDSWTGTVETSEPPAPCIRRQRGKMPSHGSYVDGQIQFGGDSYEVTEVVCGGQIGYNPDQFSGKVDPNLHEFQALNNDGGSMVNEPSVFRRIGCLDDGRKDTKDVAPPPFFPKHKSGGC